MVFTDTLTPVAEGLIRFSSFVGHAILFGCIPIALLVLRPVFVSLPDEEWGRGRARVARRIDGLIVAMLVVTVASAVIGILLKAILIADLTRADLGSDSFESVLSTSFGRWFAVRIPLAIALGIVLVGRVRKSLFAPKVSALWWGSWAALSLALLASTSFAGHAAVAQPRALALLTDVVHLASGATWFTGIVFLAIVVPDAWISKEPVARLSVLTPAVLRFSQVALISIAIVAITGTINSLFHVGRLADMTGTTYGQTLTAKIVLFVVILALGAVNHFFLRRRFERVLEANEPSGAHKTFRKTIAIVFLKVL